MSRHSEDVLILAIPVTHEQATLIHKEDYIEPENENIQNEVFLFTDNKNFYREVFTEYDEDESVPHFYGVELSEHLNLKNSEVIKMQLNGTLDTTSALSNYELFAVPILQKLGIPLVEPTLIIVTQVY